jgi:hypothetical protein
LKKTIFVSFLFFLCSAVPAQAQVVRRPFLQRFFTSPVVHQIFESAISQYLPGIGPIIADATKAIDNSKIIVDSSVTTNLNATKSNLQATDAIMQRLMKANGLSTGAGAVASGDVHPDGPRIRVATKDELLKALDGN